MHTLTLMIICMLSSCWLAGCAKMGPEGQAKQTVEHAGAQKEFDMHAPYVRYHFADPDMDFTFGSVVLGSTSNHGCETGEAFYVAANIKDGDAASWQQQWITMAEKVEARGRASLAAGHSISAREQLLRASNYYRFGLMAMMPDDPRLKPTAAKSRENMKQAGALFESKLEYIEIPFEGTVLPGYFRKAKGAGPHKTLLMLGGGETYAEDLVFYIMPQAIERGYNFMTLDLPGQGLLPLEGKTFRPEMDHAVKKAVDYVLSRKKDVDASKLAVFGISGGGGFAPQAAQFDPRIKAVVMNACVVDAYPLFASMTPVVTATPEKVASFTSFHRNTVKSIAWRWGVSMDNVPGLVEANRGFRFDPAKVTVPALSLVGEGEYQGDETRRQQKLCMDGLPNPMKGLVVTPLNEGASNHCVMENRSLVAQVVFDWLDGVFKK